MQRAFITLGIILTIAAGTPLHAFDPVRFSPLDLYVLKGGLKGPKSLQMMDASGKLRQRATLDYDGDGYLLRESYFSADGASQGSTLYAYKDGRLSEERSLTPGGVLISRRAFEYKGKNLASITSYDSSNQIVSRIAYTYQGDRLVSGVETHSPDRDRFQIEYAGPSMLAISYASPDGKPISTIRFSYGQEGRVTERERILGPARNACRYQYDSAGRITSYSYYEFVNGGWVLEKTLRMDY